MTYFTMLGAGASKKALAEVAKVNNSKQTEMEVEELVLKEVKNGKTRDTPIQTSNASPAKSVQSETPATIQQISNLTLVRWNFSLFILTDKGGHDKEKRA